jgi:hypothetical protein
MVILTKSGTRLNDDRQCDETWSQGGVVTKENQQIERIQSMQEGIAPSAPTFLESWKL